MRVSALLLISGRFCNVGQLAFPHRGRTDGVRIRANTNDYQAGSAGSDSMKFGILMTGAFVTLEIVRTCRVSQMAARGKE